MIKEKWPYKLLFLKNQTKIIIYNNEYGFFLHLCYVAALRGIGYKPT